MKTDLPPQSPADDPRDALAARYRDAVKLADEPAAPADAVRAAILAQAAAQAHAAAADHPVAPPHRAAANDGRWRLSAVASVMAMGLAGLLAWHVNQAPESDAPAAASAPTEQAPQAALAPEPSPPVEAAVADAARAPAGGGAAHDGLGAPARPTTRAAAKSAAPTPAAREREPAPAPLTESTGATGSASPEVAAPMPAPPAPAPADAMSPAPAVADAPADTSKRAPSALLRRSAEAERQEARSASVTAYGMPADRAAPAAQAAAAPRSALGHAAARGDLQRVQELLAGGAPADARDAQGRTALLEAVLLGDGSRRYVDIARALLEARADPNASDRDGVTPLAHARRLGQDDMAAVIQSFGGR